MKLMNIVRYKTKPTFWAAPRGRWNDIRDEMDRLLDGSLAGFVENVGLFGGWNPAVNISQDNDNVYLSAEIPGMKREEIELTLHEGVLTISGERKKETVEREGETVREERYYGKFQRSVTLPAEVDPSKVQATYRDGILTVDLPKAEKAKPKQIQVNVD